MKSLLYPASPTSAQRGPKGLRKKFGTAVPTKRGIRGWRREALGEGRGESYVFEEVAFDVFLVGLELGERPAGDRRP